MKTYIAKIEDVKRKFFIADAKGKVLGRLATRIATILSGKHKVIYAPHMDTGDYVIVLNADQIRVTGNKLTEKKYRYYSGYPSGLREIDLGTLLKKKPKDAVLHAVKNMLPKSKLGKKMLKKLRLYSANEKPELPKSAKEIKI